MSLRPPTPSERVIITALVDFWKGTRHVEGDGFNMSISRAAIACGVPYLRAEKIARRTISPEGWLFPCGGW